MRVVLRLPGGETLVRTVVDGRWADPSGSTDSTVGERMWAIPGLVDGHAHFAAVEGVDWVTDDVSGRFVAPAKPWLQASCSPWTRAGPI